MPRVQEVEHMISQVRTLGQQLREGAESPGVAQFQNAAYLNVMGPQHWRATFSSASDEDLCLILMGITYLETQLSWGGGSACSGIWIFKELVSRSLPIEQLDRITAWVVRHRRNEYNPFGTTVHGDAETYSEFLRFRQAHEARSAHRRAEITAEEEAARLARQQRREQRERVRLMSPAERAARIARLTGLTRFQQLELIISDQQVPVNFYPGWIAGALNREELVHLSPHITQQLHSRLRGRFKGPWGALKKRLLKSQLQSREGR